MDMETLDSDVPLGQNAAKVALIFNLKRETAASDAPDAEAEYDNMGTIQAIKGALEARGLRVCPMEADGTLADRLQEEAPDIAFNIAEGRGGRGREAQAPALLDMLGIPYTGSDETTLAIALDKALTKRVLTTYHVRSPKSLVLREGEGYRAAGLKYPLIVKPNCEGSSKGISDVSIVRDAKALRELAKKNLDTYHSEMLAEEYIEGREFTVGALGNGDDLRIFSPMEIVFTRETQETYHVYSFTVKQNYKAFVKYECPAKLSPEAEKQMTDAARRVFTVLKCRDFARMDFRMDSSGAIYFIEVNPLPGLAPGYSDYPMLADFCGVKYEDLVYGVLESAAKRCGIDLQNPRKGGARA